ncbi:MAG: polyprenyl synthetase family protein [Prevotellaceae bacterium]|jgi:geranylgeranyl diphosphate synthase type II|nr:polyprenyl synthetase family protein [Prevotellaceae bacterium]
MTAKGIQQLVENEIDKLNWKLTPYSLYEPIEYVLSLGGKRIRPVFTLLGCQLFDNTIEKALNPALAIEVFHNFTLLHDDIMDKAEMRRNQPTVHVKWDENRAILSGDAMLIKAYQLLAQCDTTALKSVLDVFSQTSVEVCEGQQYDMEFESRNDVSIDEYINMIRLKTAVLLAGSLKIGAICGGASAEDADLLYRFGIGIGIAFQLKDDYLDVYGDTAKFGKKIGGDICCNKKTFLLLTALKKADPETKAELLRQINANDFDKEEKIKAVSAIYEKLDIRTHTENAMKAYYEDAVQSLKKVSVPDEQKAELSVFAENLLYREN